MEHKRVSYNHERLADRKQKFFTNINCQKQNLIPKRILKGDEKYGSNKKTKDNGILD